VSVTLASLTNGVASTGPLFGGNSVLEYQLTVHDSGPDPTGTITLTDNTPRDALYDTGTATCGNVSGCSVSVVLNPVKITHEATVTYTIKSVVAGSSPVVSFDVLPRQGSLHQKIPDRAHWSGSGCAKRVCLTNLVVVPVVPRPVQLTSLPLNQATVQTGEAVDYSLLVRNKSAVTQANVTVTDPVPAGTAYVSGSASCRGASGCTASESAGVVHYTIASVSPHSHAIHLVFSVTVTSSSASISNTGTWTGDLCVTKASCATNTVKQTVEPGSGVSVTKSSSPTASVNHGGTITYMLTISNSGAFPSGAFVISDGIPPGTTYVAGSATCGSVQGCSASLTNGSVVFNIAGIAPFTIGDMVKFQVNVNPAATGSISNTAIWLGPACVTSSGCPTNTVTLNLGPTSPATLSATGSTTTAPSSSTSSSHSTSPSSGSPGVATSASHGALASTGAGRGVSLLLELGGGLLAIGAVAAVLGIELSRRRGVARAGRRNG
ncbi:MAG: hypothetical protein ACRD6W_09180, partial [Nitrososphaerales archaeon]